MHSLFYKFLTLTSNMSVLDRQFMPIEMSVVSILNIKVLLHTSWDKTAMFVWVKKWLSDKWSVCFWLHAKKNFIHLCSHGYCIPGQAKSWRHLSSLHWKWNDSITTLNHYLSISSKTISTIERYLTNARFSCFWKKIIPP